MRQVRLHFRLGVLAVVALVGVAGCALDPQADPGGSGGGLAPAGSAEQRSGASAAAAPDQPTRPPTASPRPTASTAPQPVRTTSPKPKPSKSATASPKATPAGCPQGEHHRDVEAYLAKLGGFGKVTVDGRQSAADCAAIKKFQQRYDIRPAVGRAGPLTYEVAKRLAGTDVKRCHAGSGTTFCVDLTRQTTWVMRGGSVVAGPTVTRTGMPGFATPAGTYTIFNRDLKEWSDPYEVWLPYWQQFNGGIGFHETTTWLHESSIGSHGCVNLLPTDAVRWWELGKVGSRVVLIGRRPGT